MHNFITIEGNIGSGKTSLSKLLSDQLNAQLILEEFEENPFLAKFYKEPSRYAFQLELSFLAERFQQIQNELSDLNLFSEYIISDYMIEKCLIFSKSNLDEQSFHLYRSLYDIMLRKIPKPSLIIYLYKDIELLLQNIAKRNRPYEKSIDSDYLQKIHESYMTFFKQQHQYSVLLVDTNDIDFVKHPILVHEFIELIQSNFETGLHRVRIK